MSRQHSRLRRSLAAAALALTGALVGALGCQSIADIPDVSYSAICNDYCDLEFRVCPGLVGQYDTRSACLQTCLALDASADGSRLTVGNTVPCRVKNLHEAEKLQAAPSDLQQACTRGGPGGGDTCTLAQEAPDCEGYCAIYRAACKGDSTNPFVSSGLPNDNAGTQSECIQKCRGVPAMTAPGYTWQSGRNSNNTLGCRLYFATAALSDPKGNCDFAGLRPNAACENPDSRPSCSDFCLALNTACTGDLAVFESKTQCEAVCAATQPGIKDSIEKLDTIACRSAHAFNALLVKATDHCPHTGPLGAGVCGAGGNCEAYCTIANTACPSKFNSKYARQSACVDECTKVKGHDGGYSVKLASQSGDSLQCRALAVSRVLELPAAQRDAACGAVFGEAMPCSD